MASLQNESGGWRLQVYYPAGRRRSLYLGRISRRGAGTCKRHIEELVRAGKAGTQPDAATVVWLGEINSELHAKIAAAGLCSSRRYQGGDAGSTVGAFLDKYIADRDGIDWKPNSTRNYKNSRRWIIGYFGEDCRLTDITLADVKRWRRWMEKGSKERKPLAESTAAKHHKRARECFTEALNDRLIHENPFRAKICIPVDEKKQFYINREMADGIIQKCDGLDWQLIFALCRYTGLRCPSEVLNLNLAGHRLGREPLSGKGVKDRFGPNGPTVSAATGVAQRGLGSSP